MPDVDPRLTHAFMEEVDGVPTELIPRRVRPRVLEMDGVQLTADVMSSAAKWCGGTYIIGPTTLSTWIDVPTYVGIVKARSGDWILKSDGKFSVCLEEAFPLVYEVMSEWD